jgi:polyhydroxybutyrate depolymerase
MAFRFAAERADLIAAVAPVAGYCRTDARPSRPVPTLYLIGTADPLIPVDGGPAKVPWADRPVRRPPVAETLDKWAVALGGRPSSEALAEVDGVQEELYFCPAEFRVMFIDGLGHHWPGGKGQLNPRIAGPPSDRMNANEVIWAFFRRHAL